jgi:hypothetical protein
MASHNSLIPKGVIGFAKVIHFDETFATANWTLN